MGFGNFVRALFEGPAHGPQQTQRPEAITSPIAVTDRYFTDEGRSTSLNVIANDSDPDGHRLTLLWVDNPANGTAVRNANGTVTYTPDPGFTGVDTFGYRIVDELRYADIGSIVITVHPLPDAPPGDILLNYSFDYGMEGMRYADDRFGAPGSGDHARGAMSDGSLAVVLGAADTNLTEDISGGWRVEFTLAETQSLLLEFSYSASLDGGLEQNEQLSVMASIDGVLLGASEGPIAVHNTLGDGEDVETGWIPVSLALGDIAAGAHVLDIGAHLGRRNDVDEIATLRIDDLSLYSNPAGGPVVSNDDPKPTPLTTRLSSDDDFVFLRAVDEEIDASFGNDEVNGMGGNDVIYGSAGDDILRGAKGNDTLVGGDGADAMWGGSGDDVLWGGAEVDVMVGDGGSDTFRFSESSWGTVDRVRDFLEDDADIIDISYLVTGFGGASDLSGFVEMFENDGNTIIKVDRDGGADSFERVAVLVNTVGLSDAAALYSDGMLVL